MKFPPYLLDPDKSITVYRDTEMYLNNNMEFKRHLEELGWLYHSIGHIIPQNSDNYWSGHYAPFVDSWKELQVSFTQLCFGLYKQAFVSLRSGLELGLISVYFNINNDGHILVKDWLSSNLDTPRTKKIWKVLKQNNNIDKFNTIHNLEKIHEDLGYLHNYVHSNGDEYSNRMGLLKSNFQTFEGKLIQKWLKAYEDIVSLVSSLHLLKYPISVVRFDYSAKFGIDIPHFGRLDDWTMAKIASILPDGYMEDIEKIAESDVEAIEMTKSINALPDLTQEQVEERIISTEKFFIKNGEGFTKWLEDQENLLKLLGLESFDEEMKVRISILRQWAEENGFV